MEKKKIMQGYQILEETETGITAMNENTGEVETLIPTYIPDGSRIITPEEAIKIYKNREAQKEKELKKYLKNKAEKPLGDYFFALADNEADYFTLKPATLARLIYLSTYIGYNSDYLKIDKEDLQEAMELKKYTFYEFLKEVNGNYLIFEDKQIRLNPPYLFRRGKFSKQTDEERERRYQKIYIEAVQELYKNTPPTSHGSLGYVYKLMPYINIEWNIICKYPLEKDIDKIFPLTTDEICEKLGYSTNQRSRFINTYKSIKFKVKDHEENFVAFVSNGEDVRMFVNPRIMYKGSNWERVSILGTFMKPRQTSSKRFR